MLKAVIYKVSFLSLFSLLFIPNYVRSQTNANEQSGIRCYAVIENNDTVPVFFLDEVGVTTNMVFKTKRMYEQWTRVKYNVKKYILMPF